MTNQKYLYCISDEGGEDFITTSFIENVDGTIDIFNFSGETGVITHISIDYTFDPFTSFHGRYTNSNAIEYYSVNIIDIDLDRNTIKLKKSEKFSHIDLKQYKREKIIDRIIH